MPHVLSHSCLSRLSSLISPPSLSSFKYNCAKSLASPPHSLFPNSTSPCLYRPDKRQLYPPVPELRFRSSPFLISPSSSSSFSNFFLSNTFLAILHPLPYLSPPHTTFRRPMLTHMTLMGPNLQPTILTNSFFTWKNSISSICV